jgi:FkbM family methyltransferase
MPPEAQYDRVVTKRHGLTFTIRPNTTDQTVINEVIEKNAYQKRTMWQNGINMGPFLIGPNQVWLDLGGNIGTFAVLALKCGAQKVICYEPEQENFELLRTNLQLNQYDQARYTVYREAVSADDAPQQELYLCRGTYNKYRHSLIKIRGRDTVPVACVSLDLIRQRDPTIDSVKMDIEGAEIALLEKYDRWDGINRLVFEYSFDVDPSIPRFLAIIERLRRFFRLVHYTKVKSDELEYNYFPRATMVYCLR